MPMRVMRETQLETEGFAEQEIARTSFAVEPAKTHIWQTKTDFSLTFFILPFW